MTDEDRSTSTNGVDQTDGSDFLAGYPDVMTCQEVASVLRFTEQVIRRMAESGKLKGSKVGGSWRFLKKDIRAVMEGPQG